MSARHFFNVLIRVGNKVKSLKKKDEEIVQLHEALGLVLEWIYIKSAYPEMDKLEKYARKALALIDKLVPYPTGRLPNGEKLAPAEMRSWWYKLKSKKEPPEPRFAEWDFSGDGYYRLGFLGGGIFLLLSSDLDKDGTILFREGAEEVLDERLLRLVYQRLAQLEHTARSRS